MAFRARLAAPKPETRQDWPWHQAKFTSLASHLLWSGDRRMEAENYLSSGYGLRLAIQSRAAGWQRFGQMARVTMPFRTKGTLVSPDFGTPFLAATQVFDIRPVPRKWLAVEKIANGGALFTPQGTILVTRSGAVGRSTIAGDPHKDILISDDLLRVAAIDSKQWGWIYAFLRSRQARAMMIGAQYGHIIKHLETSHLEALPVPVVSDKHARDFHQQTAEIFDLRNRAHDLSLEAEEQFQSSLGPLKVKDWGEEGYTVRAAAMFAGRRRLEGVFHNPGVATIRRHLAKHGRGFTKMCDSGFTIWLPSRFRRLPAEDGAWFLDSADLFETNPDLSKRIAECDFGDPHNGRVKSGWLLLARSGQTYGINGSVVIATAALEEKIISDHVIRIAPEVDSSIRVGYLHVALAHPSLGRPLVKALAYGSSIPEIDPADFAQFEVVRLTSKQENAIADLAEESASLRARADVLERSMAEAAGELIDKFVAGDTVDFVTTMPTMTINRPVGSLSALPEHARVRLLHDFPDAGLKAGATGTIVFVYDGGGDYEVEFLEGKKRPVVLTVEASDIALLKE